MSRIYTLLAILVSVVSFTIIFLSLKDVEFYPQADEGYYLGYASYMANKGIGGFPDLLKEYMENEKHWIFPPPTRAGFVLISSVWFKVFGPSFLSLAQLSLFSFFLFLLVSFYFAKKHFGEEIAFLLILLLAFSPLNMGMARRALTDSTANLFLSLSIWLFLDLLKKGNLKTHIVFIISYSLAILTRESSIFLTPILLFCLVYQRFVFKEKVKLIHFFSAAIFPVIIVIAVLALLSFGQFYEALKTFVRSTLHSSNKYLILFCSGPWFRYLIDWLILSPLNLIFSIGFVFYYFCSKNMNKCIGYFIVIFIGFLFIYGIWPYKIVRFTIMLETCIRLFSIFMLRELFRKKVFMYGIIISIVLFDCCNFKYLFVEKGIYDPVSTWLLKAKCIIP
ncbi:TPA: hypothetical protein DCX16_02155 [bacterium]|nr:hypothetical protein [bacterium]